MPDKQERSRIDQFRQDVVFSSEAGEGTIRRALVCVGEKDLQEFIRRYCEEDVGRPFMLGEANSRYPAAVLSAYLIGWATGKSGEELLAAALKEATRHI